MHCSGLLGMYSDDKRVPCPPHPSWYAQSVYTCGRWAARAHLVACRYVRIWDDEDEALQPEWEIDPKDLQILEKVCDLSRCPGPASPPGFSCSRVVHHTIATWSGSSAPGAWGRLRP